MGEGILMYGIRSRKRRYTRDLQSFADSVLRTKQVRGSMYIFGNANRAYLRDLAKRRIEVKSNKVVITDKTILKYVNHPKRLKGATVSTNRFVMVEAAVKHPRNGSVEI